MSDNAAICGTSADELEVQLTESNLTVDLGHDEVEVQMTEPVLDVQLTEEALNVQLTEDALELQVTEVIQIRETSYDVAPRRIMAGENIAAHKAVWISTDSKVYIADRTSLPHRNLVVGVTTEAALADTLATIMVYGQMSDAAWTFTPGLSVFLGLAGEIIQGKPPSGFLLSLGRAIDISKIQLEMRERPVILA